jgi:hypothetical protein
MTITNFKLDTKTLPVFIPVIEFNDGDSSHRTVRNKTIYAITLYFHGISFTQNVSFKTEDMTVSGTIPPAFKNGYADYSTGYYNVYNYESFIVAVNRAIVLCLAGLTGALNHFGDLTYKTLFETAPGILEIPTLVLDKGSGIVYLNAPKLSFNDDITEHFVLYLNEPLYRLFNSLPNEKERKTTNTYNYITAVEQLGLTQLLFKIVINGFKDSSELQLFAKTLGPSSIATTKSAHLIVHQRYETLTSWTPVESISITSSNMPIKSSIISNNHSFVNGRETTEGSTNIIEMELSEFRAGDYTPGLIYEPKNFRWVNMIDQRELIKMNLQVYWRFKYTGQLLPLYLNSGGSFSLKLMN